MFSFFQVGNGLLLTPATSDAVELNATTMSRCVLDPAQCTSGSTYMFWINLQDTPMGAVLTTLDWQPPRAGIRVLIKDDGTLKCVVFAEGPTKNRFATFTPGLHDNLDTWQHVAIVWKKEPRIEVYYDGVSQTVTQPAILDDGETTSAAPMRMILGREHVTWDNNMKTKHMIIDELMFFDRPLTENDVSACLV